MESRQEIIPRICQYHAPDHVLIKKDCKTLGKLGRIVYLKQNEKVEWDVTNHGSFGVLKQHVTVIKTVT